MLNRLISGFAKTKKAKITNFMYKKIDKAKREARCLALREDQLPQFKNQLKLVEQQLRQYKFDSGRAAKQLASTIFFPELLDTAPLQLEHLPSQEQLKGQISSIILANASRKARSLTPLDLKTLIDQLTYNSQNLMKIRQKKTLQWQEQQLSKRLGQSIKPCPYQFWDLQMCQQSQEWKLVAQRALQLAEEAEWLDQAIQLSSQLSGWTIQQDFNLKLIKTVKSSFDALLHTQSTQVCLMALRFIYSQSGQKQFIDKFMGVPHDFRNVSVYYLEFFVKLENQHGPYPEQLRQYVINAIPSLSFSLTIDILTQLKRNTQLKQPLFYRLLACQPTADLKCTLKLCSLLQQQTNLAILDQLASIAIKLLVSHLDTQVSSQALKKLSMLIKRTRRFQFSFNLAVSIMRTSLQIDQFIDIGQIILAGYQPADLYKKLDLAQALLRAEELQTGKISIFLPNSKIQASQLKIMRSMAATTFSLRTLWVLLRSWIIKRQLKYFPYESVLTLMGKILPCDLSQANLIYLIQVCLILSSPALKNNLPLTVIKIGKFKVSHQNILGKDQTEMRNRLRDMGYFVVSDSKGHYFVRAGQIEYLRGQVDPIRQQFLKRVKVRISKSISQNKSQTQAYVSEDQIS